MTKPKKLCILCNDPLPLTQTKNDIDRQAFLRLMYTEILGMNGCFWLAQYSTYPVCAACTEPIDHLCATRQKFKMYEYQYEKLKEKFVKMLVHAYCSRKIESCPTHLMKEFCERKDVVDSICQEWKSNFMEGESVEQENLDSPENTVDTYECEEFVERVSPQEDFPYQNPTELETSSNPDMSELPSLPEPENSEDDFEIEPLNSPDSITEAGNLNFDTVSDDNFTAASLTLQPIQQRKPVRKPKDGTTKQKKLRKRRIECTVCHKTIIETHFKEHMKVHSDERPFGCSDCALTFRRKRGLKNHQKCHLISDDRIYTCHKCQYPIKTKLIFLKHLHNKHLNEDVQLGDVVWFYYCDVPTCHSSFSSEEDLRTHLATHTRGSTCHCCTSCGKAFAEEHNLLSHMLIAHADNTSSHSCKFCHLNFETSDSLQIHLDIHKIEISLNNFPYLCDLCGMSFALEFNLLQHHRRFHEGKRIYKKNDGTSKIGMVKRNPRTGPQKAKRQSTKSRQPRREPRFACTVPGCGKKYTLKNNLRIHSYTHDPNYEGFCCNQCGNRFEFPYQLRHHIRVHHEGGYPKNMKCHYCTEYFPFNFTLRKHMVRKHAEAHLQEKSHYCQSCFHCFSTEEDLTIHCASQHQKSKCQFCGKQFSNKARLDRHLPIHTGKTYSCEYCGKKFNQEANCKEHLVQHTGDYPHKCNFCSEGFLRRKQFIAHMQKVHNQATVVQPTK